MAELLSDLPALKPDYVITFDHSRLAHKMAHYASIAWSIAKAGSRLEIASQPHRDANELAEEIITQIGSVQIVDFSNENTDSEKHDEK
ncbi:hypothetical protein DV26_44875 [Amycolatopsis mediterranei]|nr:hypothetical protein DV26_44875 [Amycolatopsis mediterranei]KDU85434.1 hypothetical protein DV36_46380 [Amycolatopsis mediterranei]